MSPQVRKAVDGILSDLVVKVPDEDLPDMIEFHRKHIALIEAEMERRRNRGDIEPQDFAA